MVKRFYIVIEGVGCQGGGGAADKKVLLGSR